MIDNVCDSLNEVYIMGDLNIDWKSLQCSSRNKLYSVTEARGLEQLVTDPTRICCRSDGSITSTLIDHMFTNAGDICSKAISFPVACSDHNLIVVVRKTKVPKGGQRIIVKRSYKQFIEDDFIQDVHSICWDEVLLSDNPDDACNAFNKLFLEVSDKHAPLKKRTVREVKAGWIDNELKERREE